mmetsp:Transcript_51452/g.135228  ORF Transcript_51452/g.135228 Transcript_51452/m.135228 type:complete len:205 (+) Transcript_51452:239-853(+)
MVSSSSTTRAPKPSCARGRPRRSSSSTSFTVPTSRPASATGGPASLSPRMLSSIFTCTTAMGTTHNGLPRSTLRRHACGADRSPTSRLKVTGLWSASGPSRPAFTKVGRRGPLRSLMRSQPGSDGSSGTSRWRAVQTMTTPGRCRERLGAVSPVWARRTRSVLQPQSRWWRSAHRLQLHIVKARRRIQLTGGSPQWLSLGCLGC